MKIILLLLLLVGCVPTEEEFVSKQEEHYEVLALYSSPYAYVTLQNLSTMKTFEDVYLSKSCINLKNWSKGDFISLTRYRYKTPTGVTESFSNAELNLKFCQ